MKQMMAKVAENITSTVKLNDGVSMPLFGLGVWRYLHNPISNSFLNKNAFQ